MKDGKAIHEELGKAYVPFHHALMAVDMSDPAAILMAEEERAEGDAWVISAEAWREWLAWIFGDSPHPLRVARRLVGCTAALAPWLVRDLPAAERGALEPWADARRAVRVLAGGKPAEIDAALARLWRRERAVLRAGGGGPSLAEMLAAERGRGEEREVRERALVVWLQRVWRHGPAVREALKIVYVDVRAVAADVGWNMSGEEVAVLFGQGRAAESARVRREYSLQLERAGFRSTQARFQKSATTCRKYAAAQQGNQNRRAK